MIVILLSLCLGACSGNTEAAPETAVFDTATDTSHSDAVFDHELRDDVDNDSEALIDSEDSVEPDAFAFDIAEVHENDTIGVGADAEVAPLYLASSVYATSNVVPTTNAGSTYLAMAIPFSPIDALRNALEERIGRTLANRGEAHITIIRPAEKTALAAQIEMPEIFDIALEFGMQSSNFEVYCLGRGHIDEGGRTLDTYYVVVDAPNLVAIRTEIARRFIERGGSASAFNAERLFAHITVGYTDRDLHDEDGVIKDTSSCYLPIVIE